MRFLGKAEYQQLIEGAALLRSDNFGPKVYQAPDGQVIKLFRVKRWWSSSMLYPYSLRFLRNTRRLRARGVPCVEVKDVFYCHAIRRHGVIYRRLDGTPLDELLGQDGCAVRQLYVDYARFIATLHTNRIYFRSLHPGNILLTPGDGFGLIDVADMRFPILALSLGQRRRNFQHLLRSVEFRDALGRHPAEAFIDGYLEESGLGSGDRENLRQHLVADFRVAQQAS